MIATEGSHEDISKVSPDGQSEPELEEGKIQISFNNSSVEPNQPNTQLITGSLMQEQLDFEVRDRSRSQFGFDCESSTKFIEAAMALDFICLETVEAVEDIIKLCSSPIDIKDFEGSLTQVETKQDVFLWMIQEAVTNSYQMLHLQNDSKKWNSMMKKRLKVVRNNSNSLHEDIKTLHRQFLEVEEHMIQLGNNIKQAFSGNIIAATTLNGKYANKKFNEVVQPRESKWRKSKKSIIFPEEITEHSLQLRLSLGCLTLKTKSITNWVKFKSIAHETDMKFIIDAIIDDFLTLMSTSSVLLHELKSQSGVDSSDFGINRIIDKLRKISNVFQNSIDFWPKEKTFMLQQWLKAEIGFDYLLSKINLLFKITEKLQIFTEGLFGRNFLKFVGDDYRSTLPLNKFSSVEMQVIRTDKRISDILRKYIFVERSTEKSLFLAYTDTNEEDSGNTNDQYLVENIPMEEGSSMFTLRRTVSLRSSDTSTRHEVSFADENNIFRDLEDMENQYKTSLEELQTTKTIEDRHLSLCCDRVRTFYDKISVLQNTILQNTKTLRDHSGDFFNLEDATLDKQLLGYLGVTFQLVKNCDYKRFTSSEKVKFQNLTEELARNIENMKKSVAKYEETFADDRQLLKDYIGEFTNIDTAYAQNRSENEWKLQQVISTTLSKMKQRGSVKSSLRFLTGSDAHSKYDGNNLQGIQEDSQLFTERKLNQLLTTIPIFSNAISAEKDANKTRKELPNFYSECQLTIMNLCISHLSDMCSFISSNLISLISSIYLHQDVKSVRNCIKPDKNFIKLHKFEKCVIFTALDNSECIASDHHLILLPFQQLINSLAIIFEMLKKLVVQNGMIERESALIFENRMTKEELDCLNLLSALGVEDFADISLKIQEIYKQKVAKELSNIEDFSSVDSSESRTSSAEMPTIDNVFSRFTSNEDIYESLGINAKKVLTSKLKIFEDTITGTLSKILEDLNHPKVSQDSDSPFPVGHVSILSYLACITSMKIEFPPEVNHEIRDNLRKEYKSLISTTNELWRSSKKCHAYYSKKIESKYRKNYRQRRTCTVAPMTDVKKYLGEPSVTNILARIWYSAEVPHDEICLNQLDLTWEVSGKDKVICKNAESEKIDFTNIGLETQVKLVSSFLKIIREALSKAISNFTHFGKNIKLSQKGTNSIWQKKLVNNYQNSYISAVHAQFLKHGILESSLRIQMLQSIIKDVKFFTLYGYTTLFGNTKKKNHLSTLKPIKCKTFTVRLKRHRHNDVKGISPVDSKVSVTAFPTTEENEQRNSRAILPEVSNTDFPYSDIGAIQERFIEEIKFESGDSRELVTPVELISVPPFRGMKFESLNVAVNRLQDLLTSSLKQSLEMIKLPNAALKENGLLKKEHVDFIEGIVTLISCAAIELRWLSTMTLDSINPLEVEYKKACAYYQKSFKGSRSYAQTIKINMDKIQSRLDDFMKEIHRGSDSLGNFLDNVMSSAEQFDNGGDASLNQEVLFKFIHNFDLASSFAKQFSCPIWNARWGLDGMGIVLKNELTLENHSFGSLSLKVQLVVLKSLITFFAFVLNTVKSSMQCLKHNSENANNYFKAHFLKVARKTVQLKNDPISEVDTREFCLHLQKLKEILNQSKSKIDEITVISSNALTSMEEAMNYIKIRFTLESTLQNQKRNKYSVRLSDYQPIYETKKKGFEDTVRSKHQCAVGANIPVELLPLPLPH